MSCDQTIEEGKDHCFEITTSNIMDVSVTVGGVAVAPDSVTDLGNGVWSICISGSDLTPPGPLKAEEGTTELYCRKIV